MLEVSDISVEYAGVIALDRVSLSVGKGEAVGLIGNNGAGKTSLLKAISGLVPCRGTITLEGETISRLPPHAIARRRVAHVPEGSQLFPQLSVHDNLTLGAYVRTKPEPEDYERVYSLFPRLKERRRQSAGTLSGGERQMAAIARGLMLRPKLLMLDEPSLGIAPVLIEAIYETVANLIEQGQTILLVEQNVGECLAVTDRAYVLQSGSIVGSGASVELQQSDEVRAAFLGL